MVVVVVVVGVGVGVGAGVGEVVVVVVVVVVFIHSDARAGSPPPLASIGLMTHEWPAMGQVLSDQHPTDQARPTKQQGINLTGQTRPSKTASNAPIAGSLASQQSAKSSARLASPRSVDSAGGAQNCTCAPVRGRSTRSCSQNRILEVSLTEPVGFARQLCLFQTEQTARNK